MYIIYILYVYYIYYMYIIYIYIYIYIYGHIYIYIEIDGFRNYFTVAICSTIDVSTSTFGSWSQLPGHV